MKKTSKLAIALAIGTLALVPQVAGADGTTSIRDVDQRDFPLVRLTVATQEAESLDAEQVEVLENGVPVAIEGVDTLGSTVGQVDAVLVIDTSNSMAGPELQTALAAARTFVQNVPASLPVGLVSFAATPVVRSPISDDRFAVEAEVSSLTATTTQGTALFDAVVTASEMFDGPGQHNIILLTDGRCRATPSGSGPCTLEGTLTEAVTAAEAAGASVFTIGLSDTETAVPTLAQLAGQTGGAHTIIGLDELESVYEGLAQELSQQFVVTYRSKAPYGSTVVVQVELPFGSAETRFLTPGLSTLTGQEPTEVAGGAEEPIQTSDAAVAVVAGLAFLAFLNLLLLLQGLREQKRREGQLRSRLATGEQDQLEPELATGSGTVIPSMIVDFAERTAGTARVGTLARRLTQAGWSLRVGELLAITVGAAIAAALVGFFFFGPLGLIGGVVGAMVPLGILSKAASKRLAALQAQLADTLMVIASSLRAGHSFLQSLDTATKEIGEPGATEFGRTMSEIRFGRDVDEALDGLVERVGSRDLDWTVTAIKIQRKIGGNLAEVLETVAKTIRERETLRRQVRVLSAEGRISAYVLTALPILMAIYLTFVNPEYLHALTSTTTGITMIVVSGVLMLIGYLWMQRIVRLDDV